MLQYRREQERERVRRSREGRAEDGAGSQAKRLLRNLLYEMVS